MIRDPSLSLALAQLGAGFPDEVEAVMAETTLSGQIIEAFRRLLRTDYDDTHLVAPRGLLSLTTSTAAPAPPTEPLIRQQRRALQRRAAKESQTHAHAR